MHWWAHFLGLDNLSGYSYGFWSGFGSDVAEFAIIGAVYGMLRKHNCHEKGCWRVGRHVVDGTPYCNRHHHAARTAAGNTALHRLDERIRHHLDHDRTAAAKAREPKGM